MFRFRSPLTASARLDFQIVAPKILYLRVGSGADLAANASVNQIAFTIPSSNIGDGTPVAATAGSGDLGNGTVTARVIGRRPRRNRRATSRCA